MHFYRKLPIPQEIKEQFPVSEQLVAKRESLISELGDVFCGKSDTLNISQ